jgi:Flp pilus assembly protein TadG
MEFALVVPVVLMFIAFALYGGFLLYYRAVADHVARQVARQVAIPVTSSGSSYPDQGSDGSANLRAAANKAAGGLLPDPTSVTVTSARSSVAPGDEVTVTVTYKPSGLRFITGVLWFLPETDDTVSRTASARRE